MEILKKLFPVAFRVKEKDSSTLLRALLIHAIVFVVASVAVAVLGFVIGLLVALVPAFPRVLSTIIGALFSLVGGAVDLYALAGVIFSTLCYCGVWKEQ